MTLKIENYDVLRVEIEISSVMQVQLNKIMVKGAGRRARNVTLSLSAKDEIDVEELANMDISPSGEAGFLNTIRTQIQILVELNKNSTPPVYKHEDGTFRALSDDSIIIDPALL